MRCHIFVFITVFASLVLAQDVAADGFNLPDISTEDPLTSDELQDAFSGQTHRGTYQFRQRHIDAYAFTETTYADGRVRHVQSSPTTGERVDTGQWQTIGNRICFDYDDPGLRRACFRIYQVGNCYYHYQTSVMGQNVRGFSARTYLKGETPNCEPSLA